MKLQDLLKDGEPCQVSHPEIGVVDWKEPTEGWGFFLSCHACEEALLVDVDVLFGDMWEKVEETNEHSDC